MKKSGFKKVWYKKQKMASTKRRNQAAATKNELPNRPKGRGI